MRGRRPGLLPLERALLEAAVRFDSEGSPEFHGFRAARTLQELGFQGQLAATGTMYTTLDRLRRGGLMESRWDDPSISEAEGRPRRRMYRITAAGRSALADAERAQWASGRHPNSPEPRDERPRQLHREVLAVDIHRGYASRGSPRSTLGDSVRLVGVRAVRCRAAAARRGATAPSLYWCP